jgi:CspA family cold shock protein
MGTGKRDWERDRPRRRGFDDDHFSPRDAFGAGGGGGFGARPARPAMRQPLVASGPIVEATVSWFNAEKGFGFVQLSDGTGDAFLHASALMQLGARAPQPGTTIKCRLAQGAKGPQVAEITEIDESTASAAPPPRAPRAGGPGGGFGGGGGFAPRGGGGERRIDDRDASDMQGTVKWFSPEKGFGFVVVGDGGKDVFVHVSVLQRAGLMGLEPNQPVRMKVAQGMKGREAVSIEVDG